jgi:hypothetical protein
LENLAKSGDHPSLVNNKLSIHTIVGYLNHRTRIFFYSYQAFGKA